MRDMLLLQLSQLLHLLYLLRPLKLRLQVHRLQLTLVELL